MRAPDVQDLPVAPSSPSPRRAWRLPITTISADVARWLLEVPGAHPLWRHWVLSVAHTRPVAGLPVVPVIVPGTSHQMTIATVHPHHLPDPNSVVPFPVLTPADVIAPFASRSDAGAVALAERCVRLIVAGTMSPDQNHRQAWARTVATLAAELAFTHH